MMKALSGDIVGRLGNQMFIIATTYSMAIDNKTIAIFPKTIGGMAPTEKETSIHRKTILRNVEYGDDFSFIEYMYTEAPDQSYTELSYRPNVLFRGYFQSEKYFKHNRKRILDLFKPTEETESLLSKKYSDLIKNRKCVSVHVRRSDYLDLTEYHAVLGENYYVSAMEKFTDDYNFVFFSDDIEWCKETFKNQNNIFIEKQDDVLDLYLMSKIPNNIIANSSFSWWAAWLNENENKVVISPKEWFGPRNYHLSRKDLTPEEWIII
jgi:hypothetical protein